MKDIDKIGTETVPALLLWLEKRADNYMQMYAILALAQLTLQMRITMELPNVD